MRVLVTGAAGFVGRHLGAALSAAGHDVLEMGAHDTPGALDVTQAASVSAVLGGARPDAIVHLAALSSVAQSHREPSRTFAVNALGTINLLAGMRDACPKARLLVIGSGEVYGRPAPGAPVREDAPLAPLSPYAVSKVAAEAAALQFHRSYGLDVVCVRPFNHLGAGQAPHFVVPSFAAQIAKIRRHQAPPVLRTGDLAPVRDFLHVEDVIAAYLLLLRSGRAGEVYNVASGEGRTIRSLLDEMLELAGVAAAVEADPALIRPVEIPTLVGDAGRLRALGWLPKRHVRDALGDVLREHGGRRPE
jgi:GDP-4-dehydro-6-deoxy-D-mannose reductase